MRPLFCIRMFLLVVIWVVCSVLILPLCLIFPFHWIGSWVYSRLTCPLSCKLLGLKIKVEGVEKLKAYPAVIISNHQSGLDVPICGTFFPKHCVCLGKRELLYIPFFGQIFWLAGNLLIRRYHRKKAMESMQKIQRLLKEKQTSIWIMPEGTRGGGQGLLPFKKGAFHTAINTGFPVIPIAVSNYGENIDLNKFSGGNIIIRILDPIPSDNLRIEDVPNLLEESYTKIKSGIEELNAKLSR
ncbi:MAG: lysophospholipid acyltransferase family protein [Halobacteriovoraceae bacterium]|nr:lysophospholipid acyltransferase family protein [Halobacteriovoraceae bacterium]